MEKLIYKKLKQLSTLFLTITLFIGCASTAPSQFYRPADYSGNPYKISGTFEPMEGWNGYIRITINDTEVIKKAIPVFSNTASASGRFEAKKISANFTKVETFLSSFIRVDVFIDAEKAASLTF